MQLKTILQLHFFWDFPHPATPFNHPVPLHGRQGLLLLWALTLPVPFYREYVDRYLWGACVWNEFHMLSAFAGFNGYLLLGHYLRHFSCSLRRTLAEDIPLFAAGLAVDALRRLLERYAHFVIG